MSNLKNIQNLLNQIFESKKALACIYIAVIPGLLFFSLSLLGLKSAGFKVMEILRDPAQQSGASSFLGFLSTIGIWLWIGSTTISFFFVLTHNFSGRKNLKELLFLTGMLSILLAVDDFFMIHDRYVPEKICYLFYAIVLGSLLIRHFKLIIAIEGFSFFLAGTFLALSIFTDLIQENITLYYHYSQIIEEACKFIGASTWLYFNGRLALFLLNPVTEKKN